MMMVNPGSVYGGEDDDDGNDGSNIDDIGDESYTISPLLLVLM